jgi:hypothetical protein
MFAVIYYNFVNIPNSTPTFAPAILAVQSVLLPSFGLIVAARDTISRERADKLFSFASVSSKVIPTMLLLYSIRI